MTAYRQSSLLLVGLLVAGGCASTENPAKTSQKALGPLAGIHSVTWAPDKPKSTDDAPACILDGVDIEPKGYVFFEPGTAEPVGYAGEWGPCIREPAIPSRYADVESLRCNELRESKIELHSFADPRQVTNRSNAKSLSRRRMKLVRSRLGKTAVPDSVERKVVHDDVMQDEQWPALSSTIGVRFSPAGCRDAEPVAPKESTNPGRFEWIPDVARGPMTWLHANKPTAAEWKSWEDLSPGYLDGRYLVYRRGGIGGPIRIIAIGKERAVCQGREVDSSDILARGSILFVPGTSTPIAYSGVGKCLTESEPSSMSPEDLECSFPEDAAVFLVGHANGTPKDSTMSATQLGQKRLKIVKRFTAETPLPDEIAQEVTKASGVETEKTGDRQPILGVRIQVVQSSSDVDTTRPLIEQTIGPAWTESEHLKFSKFMKRWVDPGGSSIETETDLHIRYQDAYGFVQTYLGLRPSRTTAGSQALESWADAMFEHACHTEEAGLPTDYLPEGAEPPQSTMDLPSSSASSSEMSSSSSWGTGTSSPR